MNDAPFWRGPVAVHINQLALAALDHYRSAAGPHREQAGKAHRELRQALLSAVAKEYWGRGFLFEQYDDATGRGLGGHPYTGMSALVALVAAAG